MTDDDDFGLFADAELPDFDKSRDLVVFEDHAAYGAAVRAANKSGDFQALITASEHWFAQTALRGYRQHYEDTGEARSVLSAIHLSATERLPLAPWAADAFAVMYKRVEEMEVRSWDELFGRMWPKNYPLQAVRRERERGFVVYKLVEQARKNGRKLQPELFDQVGEELGMSERTASKYYYGVRRMLDRTNQVES